MPSFLLPSFLALFVAAEFLSAVALAVLTVALAVAFVVGLFYAEHYRRRLWARADEEMIIFILGPEKKKDLKMTHREMVEYYRYKNLPKRFRF
jgi:hypothetical protein